MAGSVKLLTPAGGSVTINAGDTASALSITLPATNDTITTNASTQTLTNKTLTNPVINGFTGDTSVVNIGSGQIYKDASGNLGIGTASPTQKLQISAVNATINIDSTNRTWWLGSIETGSSDANFKIGTGLSRNSTHLTLTPSGNLGLGVTPVTKLDIGSGTLQIKNATGDLSGLMIYQDTGDSSTFKNYYTGPFKWYQGSTQSMTLDSSGTLLIGTTQSTAGAGNGKLIVYETTNARIFLTDSTIGTTYGAQIRGYGTTGAGGGLSLGVIDANQYNESMVVTDQAKAIVFKTNSGSNGSTSERARIDSNGRITCPGGIRGANVDSTTPIDNCFPTAPWSFTMHASAGTGGTAPTGGDGHIWSASWSSINSYGCQFFIDTDPTNYVSVRTRSSAGTWQAWRTI